MRLALLGQSLLTHDVRCLDWPGRAAIMSILNGVDVVFSDLEVALEGAGSPTRAGEFLHVAPVSVLDGLRELGVNLLGLANNHAWDLGTEGLIAARRAAAARGFGLAGTGPTIAEAFGAGSLASPAGDAALVCVAAGKIRPGAAATETSPGVAELRVDADGVPHPDDAARMLAAIRAAASGADAVITCLHNHLWESDPSRTPAWQQKLARACIDSGATVFVGHGTPQLQGIERHNGRPILHGLGSFFFQSVTAPGHYTHEAWQGLIVEHDTQSGALELTPLLLDEAASGARRGLPAIAAGSGGDAILRHVAMLSARLADVAVK